MKAVKRSVIATDDVEQTKGRYDPIFKCTNVSYLPDQMPEEIIINIFSFLQIKDLIRLAAVCKYWRNLIHGNPNFWRNISLKLSCSLHSPHNDAANRLAMQFGTNFRVLEITCYHARNHLQCKNMAFCLSKFLSNLHQTSLTSLVVNDLRCNKAEAPEASCIVDSLTRILSRSQHILHFGMPYAFWNLSDGIKVLDTVLSVSKGALQSLFVEGFFQSDVIDPRSDEFDRVTNDILSLNRLTELGIDYVFLNDDFVNEMARSYARLKKLKLFDNRYVRLLEEIQQTSWIKLTQACPEMKVALYANSYSFSIIEKLDPVLPIYALQIDMSAIRYVYQGSVARLLEHIWTNFSHSLVELHMVAGKKDKIDGELLRLVRQCTHLVNVNVSARFTNPKIKKTVLDIIQKRRRHLHLEKFPETSHKRMRKNTTKFMG